MSASVIDGRKIAFEQKKKIKQELTHLISLYKKQPCISTILIGNDPVSELYLKLRDTACSEVGIHSDHVRFPVTVSRTEINKTIHQLNANPNVHGILIQLPLPKHLPPDPFLSAINPLKDVEGFHPINLGKTLIGDEGLVPCTPLAVIRILEHERLDLKGKDVVVVNHSMVVGKPLAALLLNRNATVTICHVFTKNLLHYTSTADILITATGIPNLITEEHVKKDAVVIDVGIIQTKDGVRGDVDFSSVMEKAGKLTPVPGGVGPVTIACALENMVKTYRRCLESN